LRVFKQESLHGNVASMCLPGHVRAEKRRSMIASKRMIPCPVCRRDVDDAKSSESSCILCKGDGKVNEWIPKYEIPKDSNEGKNGDERPPCLICWDEAQFGISSECTHFYCAKCIRTHLKTVLEQGIFPAYCPECRRSAETSPVEGSATKSAAQVPSVGRITGPALIFLQRRGVITRDLAYRFLKQQLRDVKGKQFFKCPGENCERYLLHMSPILEREIYDTGCGNMATRMVQRKLGKCKCGACVCLMCHIEVKKGEKHKCIHDEDNATKSETVDMEQILKAANGNGVFCPNCNFFVLRNGGCDTVMCGGHAHGSLVEAIRNGGCGYLFNYQTKEREASFYYDIDGKRRFGNPTAEERLEVMKLVKSLEQGGCTFGPLSRSEKGTRLVLYGDVTSISCVNGRCGGFAANLESKHWFARCPQELLDRGVTQDQWRSRMDALSSLQSRTSFWCCPCRFIMYWFFWPPLVFIGIFVFILDMLHLSCCFRFSFCDPFQRSLGSWLHSFNEDVLIPKGIYAKCFSFGHTAMTDVSGADLPVESGGACCESISTLSFALTPGEIARFKCEQVLQRGFADDENFACWACCPWHIDRIV